MKKTTLTLSLLALAFSFALPSIEAKAARNDAGEIILDIADEILRRMPVPNRPGRGDQTIMRRVDQRFRGRSVIGVGQYINLRNLRGRDVKSVILVAKTARGRGQATLVINGREIRGRERVGRQLDEYEFDLPRHRNEIGDDIRSLRIRLSGNFYVKAIGLEIDRRGRWDGGRGRDGDWNRRPGFPGRPGYPGYPGFPGRGGPR